jgi:hypothetical protein
MLRQMTLKMEHAETQRALLERGRGIRDDDSRATPCQRLLEAAQQHWLLLAVLVPYNLIHPLPGVTGLVEIEQLGMEPKYRVEALIAGAMLLRVYHIFYLYQVPHSFPGCWHQHLVYQVLMPAAEALCWFGGEASPVASQTFPSLTAQDGDEVPIARGLAHRAQRQRHPPAQRPAALAVKSGPQDRPRAPARHPDPHDVVRR